MHPSLREMNLRQAHLDFRFHFPVPSGARFGGQDQLDFPMTEDGGRSITSNIQGLRDFWHCREWDSGGPGGIGRAGTQGGKPETRLILVVSVIAC